MLQLGELLFAPPHNTLFSLKNDHEKLWRTNSLHFVLIIIRGGLAKCNPLAYWTLEDTFDYIAKYKVLHHPLHAKGYPSIGDAKDTIPIPEDGSTKFVNFKFEGDKTPWLDYASERKGRFVGLVNKDGSTKSECGIHVAGAERTFDRDLWDGATKVKNIASTDDALAIIKSGVESVIVVYAPWCQFCQAMEDEFTKYAASASVPVYKFRGDEERVSFVKSNAVKWSIQLLLDMSYLFIIEDAS